MGEGPRGRQPTKQIANRDNIGASGAICNRAVLAATATCRQDEQDLQDLDIIARVKKWLKRLAFRAASAYVCAAIGFGSAADG
jgi:hypothetical protein